MIYGRATRVEDPKEKRQALHALVEHMEKGRAAQAAAPSPRELAATLVVRIPIEEASAKVRSGPPGTSTDDEMVEPCWTGEVPLRLRRLAAVPAVAPAGCPVPDRDGPLGAYDADGGEARTR